MPLAREEGGGDLQRRFAEALAAHQRGARPAAEEGYRRVLEHQADFADAWNNLGVLLNESGRHDEALACFRRLAELEPAKPRSHANLGVALRALGRSDDAKASYLEAVKLDPAFHSAQNNLGNLHYAAGEYADALRCFDAAARLAPAMPEYRFMLAKSLLECRRPDRAEAELRFVLQCEPTHADAWGILGRVWSERHCLKEALDCFDRGLAVRPAYDGLRYNRGLVRLLDGDLAGGFADYERRFEVTDFPSKRLAVAQPLWDGRELPEETLLLHAEQGLGDTLQFLRYLPEVARQVRRVLLLIQETLTPLAQLPANVELLHEGDKLPAFDRVCPLLSLPHLLGTTLATIPGNIPYLRTDAPSAVDWAPRIAGRGLRVGLVWAGNPSHQNDANRSLALASLQPLFAIPGIDYYSLQVGERRREIAESGLGERLPDLGAACGSFADTAAALRELDLLICVDTSIAHLAGGLGLPVWLLLPWMPDWRWLLEREESPWYPSLRLFRQTAAGDWEGVVARLCQALAGKASLRAAQLLVEEGREELERSGAALAAPLFWRALREHPRLARAASALAVLAYRAGNAPAAVQFGRRACRQEPGDPENWSNCGAFLKAVGRFDEALACQRQALTLAPESAAVHANLGNILGALGDWAGAEQEVRTAVTLAPQNPEFLFSLGVALREQADLAAALDVFRQTQRLAGGHVKAALHEALIELLLGDLAAGWEHYESRWHQPDCKERRAFNRPCWQGEPLAGKRILLHAEQGFGDSFQFLRYVPLVAAQGAQVILIVQPELESIAARMEGCTILVRSGEPLPDFDYHCPLLSLPRAFATDLASIPAAVPYIRPLPERLSAWQARLSKRRGYRVGLVWAGRPSHGNDANRSMRLAMFDELLAIPGIEWFSLQKGPAVEQLADGIVDLGSDLASFEDTAAVLAQLDELVTVDTSVAHLAGALGLPVRVLLPRVPDWRWLWGRKDSPWYPSARLYRQTTRGDWSAPLAELAADLRLAVQK